MVLSKKASKRPLESTTDSKSNIKKKIKISKDLKVTIGDEEKVLESLTFSKMHVAKSVSALLQLQQKNDEEKQSLLPNDDHPILLQVNSIKVPNVPRRNLRFKLPNKMVGTNDEVALIVPDLKRGRRQDHEPTIDHWQTLLRDQKITVIKDVIPMNQIKNEYGQFEQKRKLARLYDFFLVDGRIAGHVTHLLGKSFLRFQRPPTPVSLTNKNLMKEKIEEALKKTVMEIHGKGCCHTVQVATVSMSEGAIRENVISAYKQLSELYPGGIENIRSILIKTRKSVGIPIYYSLKNRNKVKTPNIKPKRPKAYETVEGELSTIGDATVKVTPDGLVQVIRDNIKMELSDDEDEQESEEIEAETPEPVQQKKKKGKKQKLVTEEIKKEVKAETTEDIQQKKIKKKKKKQKEMNTMEQDIENEKMKIEEELVEVDAKKKQSKKIKENNLLQPKVLQSKKTKVEKIENKEVNENVKKVVKEEKKMKKKDKIVQETVEIQPKKQCAEPKAVGNKKSKTNMSKIVEKKKEMNLKKKNNVENVKSTKNTVKTKKGKTN